MYHACTVMKVAARESIFNAAVNAFGEARVHTHKYLFAIVSVIAVRTVMLANGFLFSINYFRMQTCVRFNAQQV